MIVEDGSLNFVPLAPLYYKPKSTREDLEMQQEQGLAGRENSQVSVS